MSFQCAVGRAQVTQHFPSSCHASRRVQVEDDLLGINPDRQRVHSSL